MPETEADTCRMCVLPKFYGTGWTDEQINEQHRFTDRSILAATFSVQRFGDSRFPDYKAHPHSVDGPL